MIALELNDSGTDLPRGQAGVVVFLHGGSSALVRWAATRWKELSPDSQLVLVVHEDEVAAYSGNNLFGTVRIIERDSARSPRATKALVSAIRQMGPDHFIAFEAANANELSRRSELFALMCGANNIWKVDKKQNWYRLGKPEIVAALGKRALFIIAQIVDSTFALTIVIMWAAYENLVSKVRRVSS